MSIICWTLAVVAMIVFCLWAGAAAIIGGAAAAGCALGKRRRK